MWRFWAKKCRRDHLRSLWRSVVLVTVRRWQRREAAEGRWGSLIKCGITKLVTVRHGYDSPSCRFVMKFKEVIHVPRFQELKYFETKTLDGPSCLWRFVLPIVEGNKESNKRNYTSVEWQSPSRSVVTMTVCRVIRWPSHFLSKIVLLLEPTKQVVTFRIK